MTLAFQNRDPTPQPGAPKPAKLDPSPLNPETKISRGPDNLDPSARDGPGAEPHDSSKIELPRPTGDRPGEFTARPPVDSASTKSTYDGKDDLRLSRDPYREPPLDERGRFDAERLGPRPYDSRPNGNDSRLPPRDPAYLERDRDREREREREWARDRDRDRDLSRPQYGGRSYGRSHAPRPPPEQRHYEPRYPFDAPPRRYDPKDDMDVDKHPPPVRPDDRGPRPSIDDRRPPPDERESRSMVVDDRARPNRATPDDRSTRPVNGSVHSSEDRSARPPLSPDASRRAADDRTARLLPTDARAPPPADVERSRPLEERISQQPAPSLQDRLSQPVAPRVEGRVNYQPSLEERLSNAPVAGSDRPLSDNRVAHASPVEPSRVLPLSDRPAAPADVRPRPLVNDNFARPATPPRPSGFVAPRAASVARDDLRGPKESLPVTRDARDLRPRDISRERPDIRPPYRSDLDRGFGDDRRPDALDTRRYSPPPSDVRGRSFYPPRSPPPPPLGADSDHRRYAPVDPRDSRRDWYGSADDDKPRLPAWRPYDRAPERERYDRDAPPRGPGWDSRDHERRPMFSGSPGGRPLDSSRPLSSRLGDGHPPPPVDDRPYPPRDFERSRYTGPENDLPFVRTVRPRSPSPTRRGGGPNSSLDDIRPLKRARDDQPYSAGSGFYSPSRRSSMADYPPRSAGTPPPVSGTSSSFYESRGAPPPFSSASAGVEREYLPRERTGDGPPYGAAYDRDVRPPPRSPPPRVYGRPSYRPGPDPRDDRRYMPLPPRTS